MIMEGARVDKLIKTISATDLTAATILYPHGIAMHNNVDRVVVASTITPAYVRPG